MSDACVIRCLRRECNVSAMSNVSAMIAHVRLMIETAAAMSMWNAGQPSHYAHLLHEFVWGGVYSVIICTSMREMRVFDPLLRIQMAGR